MSYVPTGFNLQEETEILTGQRTAKDKLDEIIARLKAEERQRRWTLIVGSIGVLFAAIKLGVLVIPSVRVRSRKLGRL
jgi:hypothetical protein